jgi:hypothetical protein
MKTLRNLALVPALLALAACSSGSQQPSTLTKLYASLRTHFTDGKTELRKSLEAKQQAKSWRMNIDLRTHPGAVMNTVVEVACPDRERIVTKIGDTTLETIRIGADAYVQKEGQWYKGPLPQGVYPCGDQAGAPAPWAMMNEGRDMATVIATMANNPGSPITVTAGSLTQVDKNLCQDWLVSFQHPGGTGRGMSYSACLGTEDRLPRRVVMGTGGMTAVYSDWNQPMQIEAPQANVLPMPVVQAPQGPPQLPAGHMALPQGHPTTAH